MRAPLLFIFCLALTGACATPSGVELRKRQGTDEFGPWSVNDSAPRVASQQHRGSGHSGVGGPNDGLIDFVFDAYSGHLTRIDGPRCEHRPTCSRYAFLAVKKHGYLVGTFLTVDRLLRGNRSSVLRQLDIYKVEEGTRYYYDPVDNNDFFF